MPFITVCQYFNNIFIVLSPRIFTLHRWNHSDFESYQPTEKVSGIDQSNNKNDKK
jgi:hypothetical protein